MQRKENRYLNVSECGFKSLPNLLQKSPKVNLVVDFLPLVRPPARAGSSCGEAWGTTGLGLPARRGALRGAGPPRGPDTGRGGWRPGPPGGRSSAPRALPGRGRGCALPAALGPLPAATPSVGPWRRWFGDGASLGRGSAGATPTPPWAPKGLPGGRPEWSGSCSALQERRAGLRPTLPRRALHRVEAAPGHWGGHPPPRPTSRGRVTGLSPGPLDTPFTLPSVTTHTQSRLPSWIKVPSASLGRRLEPNFVLGWKGPFRVHKKAKSARERLLPQTQMWPFLMAPELLP